MNLQNVQVCGAGEQPGDAMPQVPAADQSVDQLLVRRISRANQTNQRVNPSHNHAASNRAKEVRMSRVSFTECLQKNITRLMLSLHPQPRYC